jgi:probable rRNA maturation factor
VQYADGLQIAPQRSAIRRWARAALDGGGQVTIRFVDEDEGRALNRDFRGKDYATNVLSFPYETAPRVLGDLVVCTAVAVREAGAQKKALEAHLAHLIVHGMLHLQAYDHDNDKDAEAMEAREREILARLGYDDPYAAD